jgi:hypothetical protein
MPEIDVIGAQIIGVCPPCYGSPMWRQRMHVIIMHVVKKAPASHTVLQ